MTRRILFMLIGFTVIVLVGAVVPLTLDATSHDRNSFVQAAAGTARGDAAVAQPRLNQLAQPEHSAGSALATAQATSAILTAVLEARQAGDGLLVLTSASSGSRQVARAGMPGGNWDQLAKQAAKQAQLALGTGQTVQPITEIVGSQVIAAMPVFSQGRWVGTVLLARSTQSLDHEILELWVILGSVAAAAMIAAALLGFGLARWVNRPLKGLDAAARRLADGDLAIRAKVSSGPPELRRLGTTFNTMAGRLESLVHGNRAVIADVSHQLRTPLAALRLRLDLLAADTAHSDPETAQELAGALDELARLSRLVDGLLTVARAENVVPVPVTVDVAEVARERVVAWHPVADDRSIVLVATTAGTGSVLGAGRSLGAPALAWIGEGHLEQILDNLVANALDALSPGHMVRLTTAATATGARITVSDNGPGMSAEDRERAFLRFTTSSPNGTGLGLAIVHRLVVSNGGTARLDETPGGGLTVILDFPGVPVPNGNAPAPAPAPVQDALPVGND
ncbi:MAG TPA: HAMP domain-containing sensor histidine kinase [Streptosporangiaceae bacterium]|nr:HAMP domain-containing sensor histidine kinase [Streptosporangiaceae bacterium]